MATLLASLAPKCPQCLQGRGVPRGIATVPGNTIVNFVIYRCVECQHGWRVARASLGLRAGLTAWETEVDEPA